MSILLTAESGCEVTTSAVIDRPATTVGVSDDDRMVGAGGLGSGSDSTGHPEAAIITTQTGMSQADRLTSLRRAITRNDIGPLDRSRLIVALGPSRRYERNLTQLGSVGGSWKLPFSSR
jgi:hypothetical protein